VEEGQKRLLKIERRVAQFLADPTVETFWGDDLEPNYTIPFSGQLPKAARLCGMTV